MSSRLRRLQQFYNQPNRRQRYHAEGEMNDPENAADPHTWDNEQPNPVVEWANRNKRVVVTVGLLWLIVMVVIGIWFSRFVPQVINNPIVQFLVYHIILLGITITLTIRHYRNKLFGLEWLVLVYEDEVKRYLGTFEVADGGYPVFKPLKGFSFLGLRGHPMTLGDMSSEMERQFAKEGRNSKDPAKIRIHPSMSASSPTNFGRVIAQLTAGLEPDEHGRDTDIEATVPRLAKTEQMEDLKTELEEQTGENAHLKNKVSMLRDQRDNYKEIALAREDEVEDRLIEFAERVINASQGGSPDMGGGFGGTGMGAGAPMEPEPDYGGMEDEVDDELEDDEF